MKKLLIFLLSCLNLWASPVQQGGYNGPSGSGTGQGGYIGSQGPGVSGGSFGPLGTPVAAVTNKTCTTTPSGVTSATCTWSTPPAAGEFVVCGAFWQNAVTASVVDSASDSYTLDGSLYSGAPAVPSSFFATWYYPLTGSITTTTINFSGTTTVILSCNTATGIAASPADGQCTGQSSTPPTACSAALSPTVGGDLIMCVVQASSGNPYTVGSGFTQGAGPNFGGGLEYKILTNASPITPQVSNASGNAAALMCDAFKP